MGGFADCLSHIVVTSSHGKVSAAPAHFVFFPNPPLPTFLQSANKRVRSVLLAAPYPPNWRAHCVSVLRISCACLSPQNFSTLCISPHGTSTCVIYHALSCGYDISQTQVSSSHDLPPPTELRTHHLRVALQSKRGRRCLRRLPAQQRLLRPHRQLHPGPQLRPHVHVPAAAQRGVPDAAVREVPAGKVPGRRTLPGSVYGESESQSQNPSQREPSSVVWR